ncbi:MAG: hypothetical protein BWY74_02746 [Firmicutes bacterium ADurb.Bin419]|nr:MAG: hypothetical protein BWY74_02746 [Firmicutes bacterium ADurb.Bin419]
MRNNKIYLVCADCGLAAMNDEGIEHDGRLSTFYKDICSVCGEEKWVTEARDFGHPSFKKRRKKDGKV